MSASAAMRIDLARPTRATLVRGMFLGEQTTLFDPARSEWITGQIRAVRLESGYYPGDRPVHFLVTIRPDGSLSEREIYVRTID